MRVARFLIATAVAALALPPLYGFMRLEAIPIALRGLVPVAVALAWIAPVSSVLLFVALSALLPIIPSEMRWPPVRLAEIWLLCFFVGAPRLIRRSPRVPFPRAGSLLIVITTASVLVTMYPFRLSTNGVGPLIGEVSSFLATDFILASQRHPYAPIEAWSIVVEGLGLLWLVLAAFGDRPREGAERVPHEGAERVVFAASVGVGMVSLNGISQWWTGRHLLQFWRLQDPNIIRINATFLDPNALGAYLAMMMWVVLEVAGLRDGRRWVWCWRAVALATMLAMVFTASRAAWAAALVAGLVYLPLRKWAMGGGERRLTTRDKRRVMAAAVAVLTILALVSVYATWRDVRHAAQRTYLDTLLYTFNFKVPLDERLKGRAELWLAAAEMVRARPVFGIGIGRYFKEVSAYAPDPARLIGAQENAHNYFLQTAAELGLVGLAAFVGLMASAWIAAYRAAADSGLVPRSRRLAACLAAAVVAFAVSSLAGHPLLLRDGQFAFAPILGAAFLIDASRSDPERGTDRPAWQRWAWMVLAVLVLLSVPSRAIREANRVDLSRVPFGFYEMEHTPDGHRFRWTLERATIYVPSDATTFQAHVRSLAPFPQTISIRLDDHLVDEIKLGDHAWHPIRYVLPRGRTSAPFRKIDLQVSPPWRPPNDPRVLGVMVADQGWTR